MLIGAIQRATICLLRAFTLYDMLFAFSYAMLALLIIDAAFDAALFRATLI